MHEEHNYIHETPSIREEQHGDTIMRSYHWETVDKRHIFLYLTLSLKHSTDHGSYLLAQSNIDSSEVKQQGPALWAFLQGELSTLAAKGIGDTGSIGVMHEMSPNQYSSKYVENNPLYTKKGSSYYRFFSA